MNWFLYDNGLLHERVNAKLLTNAQLVNEQLIYFRHKRRKLKISQFLLGKVD